MDGTMPMNMMCGMMKGFMTIGVILFLTLVTASVIQAVVLVKTLKVLKSKKK